MPLRRFRAAPLSLLPCRLNSTDPATVETQEYCFDGMSRRFADFPDGLRITGGVQPMDWAGNRGTTAIPPAVDKISRQTDAIQFDSSTVCEPSSAERAKAIKTQY